MHETPPVPEPLRAALIRLAVAGATGALRVTGSPGGTLWLVDGDIGYAETPVMPGVGDRLVATGRLSAPVWEAALRAAEPAGRVGRYLVDGGHLVSGELVSRVLAAVYDTAYLLLADDTAVTRFHPDLRHWLGPVASVDLVTLDAETARRRRLLGDTAGRVAVGGADPGAVPGAPHRPAVPLGTGPTVDGPQTPRGPGSRAEDGRTSPNALPRRASATRPSNGAPQAAAPGGGPDTGNGRSGPDYATLRRIRKALKTLI